MNVVFVFIATLITLFALAFITKRRFGVLGLALAAGAMLSNLWAESLTPVIASAGVQVDIPPLITVVSVALILLPALFLLFNGPSYNKMVSRFIGALLFASLAFALLIEPIGSALVLQDQGRVVYAFFADNRLYIVTIGLLIAIFDLVTTRIPKVNKASKH